MKDKEISEICKKMAILFSNSRLNGEQAVSCCLTYIAISALIAQRSVGEFKDQLQILCTALLKDYAENTNRLTKSANSVAKERTDGT